MTIPHQFPSLITGPAQVVLIVGTGLSAPNAPTVEGLKGELNKVAQDLGVATNSDFYELSEAALNRLVANGKTNSESRLWLAEKLGMLDDRRWFGEIGLPLSGNTPRHRAIARFAVEKRLRAIISLNWDTLLEVALDSVGLAEGVRSQRPWDMTEHASVVDNTDIPHLAGGHVFPVIKPHGCVRNLDHARRKFRSTGIAPPVTFKLTKSELSNLSDKQTLINGEVRGYVAECPLIAVGWKGTEGYLRNIFTVTATDVQHAEPDAFTLVDLNWHPNHTEIAAAYGKNEREVFAEVKAEAPPTTDCLFQWLQARYALNLLIAVSPIPQQAPLQRLLQQLDRPDCGHPILSWVDNWLPTWVRLCWRTGVMQGSDPYTSRRIEAWDIPIMPRDVHVPLGGMSVVRRDLEAAAKLLVVMDRSLRRFNFEVFPGGFWDPRPDNLCLYIPLPGWRRTSQTVDLAALKPQVEAMRSWGFVQKIRLIWLDTGDVPPDQSLRTQLEAQVRRLMPLTKFATGEALSWVDLQSLKGDSYASMA